MKLEIRRGQVMSGIGIAGCLILLITGIRQGLSAAAYFAGAVLAAMPAAAVFLMILPQQLGRILRRRESRMQYSNADEMRKSSMLLQIVSAAAGSLLLFFSADFLAGSLLRLSYSVLALKILAAALLPVGMMYILEGYFYGNGQWKIPLISRLLNGLLFLLFGLLFTNRFSAYGENVGRLLLNKELPAMYAAAGMATATVLAVTLSVLFLLSVWIAVHRSQFATRKAGVVQTEFWKKLMGNLVLGSLPGMLQRLFVSLILLLGFLVVYRNERTDEAGLFAVCLVLLAVPVLALRIVILPDAHRAIAGKREEGVRFLSISQVFQKVIFWGLPVSIFCLILAPSVTKIFPVGTLSGTMTAFLRTGAFLLLEIPVLLLFLEIASRSQKNYLSAGCLFVFLLFAGLSFLLWETGFHAGSIGVMAAMLTAGAVTDILIGILFFRWKAIRIPLIPGVLLPLGAAVVPGLLLLLLQYLLADHIPGWLLVLPGFGIGIAGYLVLVRFTEERFLRKS